MTRERSLLTFAFCLLPFALIAWSGVGARSPGQSPQFRAGVDLIQLDVSVLDQKTHRPVRGLTTADFTIFEDGRPQPIAAFSAVDVPDPPPVPVVDGKPVTWLRDVAPDVQSNATAGKQESRLFVMLIDDAMLPGDPVVLSQAKSAAHSVIEKLSPVDRMAVVFSMGTHSVQDFTSDKARLNAAVERLTTGYATYYFGWDNATSSNHIGFQGQSRRGAPAPAETPEPGRDSDVQMRDSSYSTLVNIADALMSAPDRRKAMVYISPGVATNPFASMSGPSSGGSAATGTLHAKSMVDREANLRQQEELPEIFRRMQRANIAIYPIDPVGLNGIANYVAKQLGGLSIDRRPQDPMGVGVGVQKDMTDFLLAAASNTGGRAVINTNNLEPGIEGIFLENGSFYLLGYQAPPTDPPGTLHRLKVEVNRKDVEVRTRSGFYTPKVSKGSGLSGDPTPSSPATKATANALPSAALPLRVALAPVAWTPPTPPAVAGAAKPKKAADAKPDANAAGASVAIVLGLQRPAPQQPLSDTVEVRVSAFTPDGVTRGATTQQAMVAIRASGSSEPVRYEALSHIELKPGRYQLRIAAYSAVSDVTGSVYADVDVPDFAKEAVSLSGILVEKTPSLPSAPRTTFAGIVPVVPTAEREFQKLDQAAAFLRIYQGGGDPPAAVTFTARIVDDHDRAVLGKTDVLRADQFDAVTRACDYRLEIPLVTLSRGQFLLTFEATRGAAVVRRDVRFSIR